MDGTIYFRAATRVSPRNYKSFTARKFLQVNVLIPQLRCGGVPHSARKSMRFCAMRTCAFAHNFDASLEFCFHAYLHNEGSCKHFSACMYMRSFFPPS